MPTKAASGKTTAGGKTVAPRPMPKRRKEPVGQTTAEPPGLKTQKRLAKKSAGTGRKAEGEAAKKPLNTERAKHPRTPDHLH